MIGYQIVVSNDGNVDLDGVACQRSAAGRAAEPRLGDTVDPGVLNFGETWTYNETYTATQADINSDGTEEDDVAGFIDNTATVSSDELDDKSASAAAPIDRSADYSITKTITDVGGDGAGGEVDAEGDVIGYQIVVSNDGNVDLDGVAVNDPLLGGLLSHDSGDTVDPGVLNFGETWTYNETYTATQADINSDGTEEDDVAGFINNTATVSSDELDDKSASAAAPIDRSADYSITKTITDVGGDGAGGEVDAEGDVIGYQIVVSNDGNVDLDGVAVNDPLLGGLLSPDSGDTVDPGVLNFGETWTYNETYTATQADINSDGTEEDDVAGFINNTATVSSDELDDESASAAAPIDRSADYSITKTITDVGGDGAGGEVDAEGDVIGYQIVVSNDGNVDLDGVAVNDPLLGGLLSPDSGDTVDPGVLNFGETWTYNETYTATQADINSDGTEEDDVAGFINNTATVSSDELDDKSASAAAPIDFNPDLSIDKEASVEDTKNGDGTIALDDVITYTVTVENTGNVTLTDVVVTDTFDGGSPSNCIFGGATITASTMLKTGRPTATRTMTARSTSTRPGRIRIPTRSRRPISTTIATSVSRIGVPPTSLTVQVANGTLIYAGSDVPPTGSGVIEPFVRLHGKGTEQGYEYDARPRAVRRGQYGDVQSLDHLGRYPHHHHRRRGVSGIPPRSQ